MNDLDGKFSRLVALMEETASLQSAADLMEWEDATGNVPASDTRDRSAVIGWLMGEAQAKKTSPEYAGLLDELLSDADDGNLGQPRSLMVRKAWVECEWARRLTPEFVSRLSAQQSVTRNIWQVAKATSDWAAVLPAFEAMVALSREKAAMLGHGDEPYDALLHEWEQGMTCRTLGPLFASLRAPLIDLSRRIAASRSGPTPEEIAACTAYRRRDVPLQRLLARQVAAAIGFDFSKGRLDESEHPFTTQLHPRDTRMTASYREDDLFFGISCATHEGGHGIYGQGIPEAYYPTPLHDAPTQSIDEAVARLYEGCVGRSREFISWLNTLLERHGAAGIVDAQALYRGYNRDEPTLSRFDAGEVGYDLHVMLRYEIERPLINGSLPANEVPEAWRALSREYLGIVPQDHASAQMQDIHWFDGAFGYFPSYTLANVQAAQLFAAATRDIPGLQAGFADGEFGRLRGWLSRNVFMHGATYETNSLLIVATGEGANPAHYLRQLERRYGEIYAL